jgi:hypothetical protein
MDDSTHEKCEELGCRNFVPLCDNRACPEDAQGRHCRDHEAPGANFCDRCSQRRRHCDSCRRYRVPSHEKPFTVLLVAHRKVEVCHRCVRDASIVKK